METLKRHLTLSGEEGVQEQDLRTNVMRFEERNYYAATSQSDYIKRISVKMVAIMSKSNPPDARPNAIPAANSGGLSRNPQDPALQVQNEAQSVPVLTVSNQPEVEGRREISKQKMQMKIGCAGGVNGLAKNSIPNVLENPNMQKQMQVQKYLDQQMLHRGNIHQPMHTQQNSILPSAQLQYVMQQQQPSMVSGIQKQSVIRQQQQHLMGQQTSKQDIQQLQRMMSQQNNLSRMSGQQQTYQNLQQQHQFVGSQSGNPSMESNHTHMLQQHTVSVQQQNLNAGSAQPHQQQQQMMQSQTAQLQQQEEVYQKVQVMKDMYFQEIHDVYQKICLKVQQHDSCYQPGKSDGIERLKYLKEMVERILQCLQMSRTMAKHFKKDKLGSLEKLILCVIKPRKPALPVQQGQMQPHSQIAQAQSHKNGVNSQMQSVHGQGDMVNSLQPASSLESGQGNAPPVNTNMLQSQHVKQQLNQELEHHQPLLKKKQPGAVQRPQIQQMDDVLKKAGFHFPTLPQRRQRYQQRNSSRQLLQKGPPQHSSSPQQNLFPPINKVSANFPLAPSPMPADPEKPSAIPPASASSLATGTPGISLAESSPPDTLNTVSGRSDQPIDNLLKVVNSMSRKALNSAVDDIGSVVSMNDRIAGSAPGNGFGNFTTQDGSSGVKRMRLSTSAMPLNVAGSTDNSVKQLVGAEMSELQSIATPMQQGQVQSHSQITQMQSVHGQVDMMNLLHPASNLESGQGNAPPVNTNVLQSQHVKQQLEHRQQLLKKKQPGAVQRPQIQQMDDVLKKAGFHFPTLPRRRQRCQQLNSSRQLLQRGSPQHSSSPQQNLLPSPVPSDLKKPNVIPPASASSLGTGTPGISLAESSPPDTLNTVSGRDDRLLNVVKSMPLNVAGSANNSVKRLIGAEMSELESTATPGLKRRKIEVNPAILDEVKDTNEPAVSDEDVGPIEWWSGGGSFSSIYGSWENFSFSDQV